MLTGPLARAAALVYTLLAVEGCLAVVAGPGYAVAAFLARSPGNAPLLAACALPAGPAISAALFSLHHRRLETGLVEPARSFWKGLRLNTADSLRIWVPWLAGMTVVAMVLGNRRALSLPAWWTVLLVLMSIASALWAGNALTLTALFRFRARDTARLASYFLIITPSVTVTNLCLLVAAAGLALLGAGIAVMLGGSLLLLALLRGAAPLINRTRRDFTTP